jgi:hypothetical protein
MDEGLELGFESVEARQARLELAGRAGLAALEARGERQIRGLLRHQFTVAAAALSLS